VLYATGFWVSELVVASPLFGTEARRASQMIVVRRQGRQWGAVPLNEASRQAMADFSPAAQWRSSLGSIKARRAVRNGFSIFSRRRHT